MNDNNNKISITTVTRNAASLLQRTILNVGEQTYPGIEYVIIDGASTDDSLDIIKKSPHVSTFISEPDKGIYDAMNKGARIASGEWILFMNAGDTFVSPEAVERLFDELHSHPDADVIYGDVIRCDKSGDILKPASDHCKGHRLAFCHQSVMCKRELLIANPFDTTHKYSADFKFFKILYNQARHFHHAHFPVARFDTSGISSLKRSKGIADNIKVIMEVDGVVKGLPHLLHILPTYLITRLRGK